MRIPECLEPINQRIGLPSLSPERSKPQKPLGKAKQQLKVKHQFY